MKKYHLLLLSLLSGLVFSAGWPANGITLLLFFAFVPLLFIEDYIARNPLLFSRFSVFAYAWPAFFIWNVLTTWWIWNSTPVGTLAWLLNSLFMALVFQVYHWVKKILSPGPAGIPALLVFLWISFEYFHQDWDLSWPWLNLGNGLNRIMWVQWYEYTGTLGGTLWIILVNYLIFRFFIQNYYKPMAWLFKKLAVVIMVLVIPVVISLIIYYNYDSTGEKLSVVVVQPNLDPYSEQYSIPSIEVANLNLDLANKLSDKDVDLVVCPESALQEDIWEPDYDTYPSIFRIRSFIRENPEKAIVIGASTFRRLGDTEERSPYARYFKQYDFWYNAYNTALFIDTSKTIQIHHKSKLTPGVEKMPSWPILRPLEKFAIDLGGTLGSLVPDEEQIPVVMRDSIKIAPVICYESVYGEFCGNFVKNGANLICIITNDGWWGNSPGHKQHFEFAKLRAIETRRDIARSANTGISAFINQKGEASQKTKYWKEDVIRGEVFINHELTFYAMNGDYLGRISAFLSALVILASIMIFLIHKRKK